MTLAGGVPRHDRPIGQRALAVLDMCPYLVGDAGWKSLTASKRHRCSAAGEASPLTIDKQQRHCLASRHAVCATYQAAVGLAGEPFDADADADALRDRQTPDPTMWAFTRPTPVLLESRRFGLPTVSIRPAPGVRQASLAAVMVVAFAILFTSRLANPEFNDGSGAVAGVQGTPRVATARPATTQRPIVVATPSASRAPAPGGSTTPGSTSSSVPPASSAAPGTYRVRSGDTLYAIAARHGTTVKAIADLNELGDGSYLKVGQKLRLP